MLRAGATQVHAPIHTDSINTNKVLKILIKNIQTECDELNLRFMEKYYMY